MVLRNDTRTRSIPLTLKTIILISGVTEPKTRSVYMKQAVEAFSSCVAACLFCFALFSDIVSLQAATSVPGIAEVRGMTGKATFTTNGSPAVHPLKVGMRLHSGVTIKTGPGSVVDLFLGSSAGILRLAENSALVIGTLTLTDTGADTAVEVDLELPDGDLYFKVNKLSKASRYEVRMPNGVAGIRGTKGAYSFRPGGGGRPPVVLLEGSVAFTHTPAGGGNNNTQVMRAPPPVYFSVTEGVKPAPPALVDEVEKQISDSGQSAGREARNQGKGPEDRRPDRIKLPEPFLSPGSSPGSHRS